MRRASGSSLGSTGRGLRAVLSGVAVAALWGAAAARADQTLTFDGLVPSDGPDHFFLPFSVPAGVAEIEVRHDDRSAANILDWGLDDPRGYRGWGGGTSESAIVGERAASRAYVPGPIPAGTWRIIVGKAKIVEQPARYHVEVVLRDAPTLPPQTERKPYAPVPPLERGLRYYAGDLHVHSLESTDARPPLDEIARFARGRGLDFVEISDHNTVTQLDYFAAAQARSPALLLVPGIEVTTYAGHANAIGATRFVEHKLGQPGVSFATTAAAAAGQGALLSINHPALDLGDACIGCAWQHPLDGIAVAGIELGTGGQRQGAVLFTPGAIKLWESLLAQGRHVAALGGSDDHQGGQGSGRLQSPIGDPTTLVLADELSVAAILDGIRRGRTVVKLQGPADPMVELTSGEAVPGDTLAVRSAVLTAKVSGGAGAQVRFVHDGVPLDAVAIDGDSFELAQPVTAPAAGEARWRVEVLVDNAPRTVTSPIYVRLDPGGPDPLNAPPLLEPEGGCRLARRQSPTVGLGVAVLMALALRAARASARRSSHG